MFYDDHIPPHIHVRYAVPSAKVSIDTLEITEDRLPRLVLEWAALHRDEL